MSSYFFGYRAGLAAEIACESAMSGNATYFAPTPPYPPGFHPLYDAPATVGGAPGAHEQPPSRIPAAATRRGRVKRQH